MSTKNFVPRPAAPAPIPKRKLKNGEADWKTPCSICAEKPTMHPTQLCGPCCTGESDPHGDNW